MKIFNKWDTSKIKINDPGLQPYIVLGNYASPSSGGRHTHTQFAKSKLTIIERLVNKMMVTGHLKEGRVHRRVSGRDTGKKLTAYSFTKHAFEIIEKKTNQNPLQTLIKAIENSAPIEETTAFRQGGIIAHKSVDVAPQRRVDLSLRFLTHGAGQRAFKKKKSIADALADELMAAAKYDTETYSIKKKEELERVAAGAR